MPSEGSALNSMLSASLGPYIGSGLYPHYRFYPTDLNPADGPTPGKPPPLATRPLPEWWDDLCCGRFEGFDDWMRSLPSWAPGPDFSHVRCDVSPEPPSVVDEVDCAPSGQLRAQASAATVDREPSCDRHPPGLLDEWPLGFPLKQFALPKRRPDFGARGALDLFCGTSKAIDSDAFLVAGMAPPVGMFSSAVTPRVRSWCHPEGFLWLKGGACALVRQGNQTEARGVQWWLEHPDSSFLWDLDGFRSRSKQ